MPVMKRMLGLTVLVLALPACVAESDEWEDEVGQSQLALSSSEPGYVTTSNTHAFANRCAVDPIGDVSSGFTVDPTYIMAYRSGKSTACAGSVSAPYIVGSPSDYHRQSIQRIRRNTQNYLFVTQSVPPPSETSWYPGFEVIAVGGAGHGTGFLDLGSAGVTPTSYSLCGDHIVNYWEYSSTVRRHAGGIQVNGNYIVAPFEDIDDTVVASFRTVDVSDPPNPVSGPTRFREKGQTTNGGAAALTRTNDSKFLIMVFGEDAADVEVFVSAGTSMPTSPTDWDSKISAAAFGSSANDYQNVQFITECDIDTSGRLFALATHKNSSGEDWVDLYRVTLNATTYAPTFTKVASRKMTCSGANTGGTRYCDFDAGAGVFVDANGSLILYGVEHYNDHYPYDDTAVKVREFPIP